MFEILVHKDSYKHQGFRKCARFVPIKGPLEQQGVQICWGLPVRGGRDRGVLGKKAATPARTLKIQKENETRGSGAWERGRRVVEGIGGGRTGFKWSETARRELQTACEHHSSQVNEACKISQARCALPPCCPRGTQRFWRAHGRPPCPPIHSAVSIFFSAPFLYMERI